MRRPYGNISRAIVLLLVLIGCVGAGLASDANISRVIPRYRIKSPQLMALADSMSRYYKQIIGLRSYTILSLCTVGTDDSLICSAGFMGLPRCGFSERYLKDVSGYVDINGRIILISSGRTNEAANRYYLERLDDNIQLDCTRYDFYYPDIPEYRFLFHLNPRPIVERLEITRANEKQWIGANPVMVTIDSIVERTCINVLDSAYTPERCVSMGSKSHDYAFFVEIVPYDASNVCPEGSYTVIVSAEKKKYITSGIFTQYSYRNGERRYFARDEAKKRMMSSGEVSFLPQGPLFSHYFEAPEEYLDYSTHKWPLWVFQIRNGHIAEAYFMMNDNCTTDMVYDLIDDKVLAQPPLDSPYATHPIGDYIHDYDYARPDFELPYDPRIPKEPAKLTNASNVVYVIELGGRWQVHRIDLTDNPDME